jgi:hypothetical protein
MPRQFLFDCFVETTGLFPTCDAALFVRVLSWYNARRYGRVNSPNDGENYSIVMLGALYHTFWVLTLDQIAGNYSNGLLRHIKILIRAEKM